MSLLWLYCICVSRQAVSYLVFSFRDGVCRLEQVKRVEDFQHLACPHQSGFIKQPCFVIFDDDCVDSQLVFGEAVNIRLRQARYVIELAQRYNLHESELTWNSQLIVKHDLNELWQINVLKKAWYKKWRKQLIGQGLSFYKMQASSQAMADVMIHYLRMLDAGDKSQSSLFIAVTGKRWFAMVFDWVDKFPKDFSYSKQEDEDFFELSNRIAQWSQQFALSVAYGSGALEVQDAISILLSQRNISISWKDWQDFSSQYFSTTVIDSLNVSRLHSMELIALLALGQILKKGG